MPEPQDSNRPIGQDDRRRMTAWGVWAVFAVALLVRIVCAAETLEVATVWYLVGDASGYFRCA